MKHIMTNDPDSNGQKDIVSVSQIENTINLIVNVGLCLGSFVPIMFPGIDKYGRIKTIIFTNVMLVSSVVL